MQATQQQQIDSSDYVLSLVHHAPDGEVFILRENSVWTEDGNHCIGTTITACVGGLHYREWKAGDGADTPRADWVAWASEYLANQSSAELAEGTEWANAEDEAGRWTVIVRQNV